MGNWVAGFYVRKRDDGRYEILERNYDEFERVGIYPTFEAAWNAIYFGF